jgi:hypothetical protein
MQSNNLLSTAVRLLTGAAAGALAMYLLDPAQGRLRRAALRDRIWRAEHRLTQRAKGTTREIREPFS